MAKGRLYLVQFHATIVPSAFSKLQMRPFKKHSSKSKQNEGGMANDSPTDGTARVRNDARSRTQNWSSTLDTHMLGLMRDEHSLGNFVNGTFTPVAWKRMVLDFNTRNNSNLTKQQMKNRYKVLKKTFNLYHSLANKSGWGWNHELHIPTPGDASIWTDVIAENPAYARCRDKPFPPYYDIEFLTQNTTASGRYAFSSAGDATTIIESSSGSSPGEDDTTAGIRLSACNLSSNPNAAGTSGCVRDLNDDAGDTSRSPSPPVMRPTGGSGSGHSSGSKRPRSPERSNRPAQTTSTFGRRSKKHDGQSSAMSDMVEISKKKLGVITQLCENLGRQRQEKPTIHTCMQRVYGMSGIAREHILTIVDAFKDESNRDAFMALQDDDAKDWIDRLIAEHFGTYRQYFPGL